MTKLMKHIQLRKQITGALEGQKKELLSTTRMQVKASKAAIVYEFIKHLVNSSNLSDKGRRTKNNFGDALQ
jgi:hypothetical protein